MSEQKVPRSVEQRIVNKFLVEENVPSAEIHHRLQQQYGEECLRGTFCSLITLATPRQDWTGSNPSRKEGGGCGFTLSRSHRCCAVRPVYTQISPGHIWTTLYLRVHEMSINDCKTSLFFHIFVGLVMTQGDPKHVAIL